MSSRSMEIASARWWACVYEEMGIEVDWDSVVKEIDRKWSNAKANQSEPTEGTPEDNHK